MDEVALEDSRDKLTRASVACRRCRRLRTKCVHEQDRPPCEACRRIGGGEAETCAFPARGQSRHDREFRAPRRKSKNSTNFKTTGHVQVQESPTASPTSSAHINLTISSPATAPSSVVNVTRRPTWDVLPPDEEVLEGCKVFWTSFHQVGFVPKHLFLERLSKDRNSTNLFLILSILSVSSRFTPGLIQRYGSCPAAGDYFIRHASQLAFDAIYEPTLENIQAFFLLALSQWGQGDRTRSSMNMGIAVRMAGILRLHREETYVLPENASEDEAVQSEMARRTFWVLETQENLHSGHATPSPFAPHDITALLPSDESDFSFGRIPKERAALAGTQAAVQNPHLVTLPSRSLFASLLQAHNHWGNVARKACRADLSGDLTQPWDETSDFARMTRTLADWEAALPKEHRWSIWNLRGHSTETVHLAYLAVTMVTRLNNVVIRRIYLDDIITSLTDDGDDAAPQGFWKRVSNELFTNMQDLHEMINTFISLRPENEGFPAMLLFCLYVCGALAIQLKRCPQLCPCVAPKADVILRRSLEILSDLQSAWPLASRWTDSLKRFALALRTTDSIDPTLESSPLCLNDRNGETDVLASELQYRQETVHDSARMLNAANLELRDGPAVPFGPQSHTFETECSVNDVTLSFTPAVTGTAPVDDCFEAELSEFLLGRSHFGMMSDWVSEQTTRPL